MVKFCWFPLLLMGVIAPLVGCSSDNGTEAGGHEIISASPGQQNNPADFALDAPAVDLGPDVALIKQPSGTDLKVAYTDEQLLDEISVDYIVTQWQNMKLCLGTAQPAPYIVVVSGFLDSVESDDVLFNFEGRRLASATWRRNGVNIIRISSLDFDGSQGNAGFHLRSIMGRYLWTLSDLPVREYKTDCASET